jgi:hypothetical protein
LEVEAKYYSEIATIGMSPDLTIYMPASVEDNHLLDVEGILKTMNQQ